MDTNLRAALISAVASLIASIPSWLPLISGFDIDSVLGSPFIRIVGLILAIVLLVVFGWKLRDYYYSRDGSGSVDGYNQMVVKKNIQTLNRLDADFRMLLCAILRRNAVYVNSREWRVCGYPPDYLSQFLEWKNLPNGITELSYSVNMSQLVSEHPNVFNDINDSDYSDHGVSRDSVNSVIARYSMASLPYWWYYVD